MQLFFLICVAFLDYFMILQFFFFFLCSAAFFLGQEMEEAKDKEQEAEVLIMMWRLAWDFNFLP